MFIAYCNRIVGIHSQQIRPLMAIDGGLWASVDGLGLYTTRANQRIYFLLLGCAILLNTAKPLINRQAVPRLLITSRYLLA